MSQGWEATAFGKRLLVLLTPGTGLRGIWEHEAKGSEQLGMVFIHDGTRMVPDNFLMACQFNWLWYFVNHVNLDGVDRTKSFETSEAVGLHLPIKQRHEYLVRFILARGVNANYWNDGTPLGVATLTNQPIMVKMLLGVDSTDLTTEPEALSKGSPRQSKGYVEVNTTASFDENTTLHLTAMHNLP
jgi:hypothetical protein